MTPPAHSRSRLSEYLFLGLTRTAAASIPVLFAALVIVLVIESYPALVQARSLQLLTSATWSPNPPPGHPPTFGTLAFVYGTIVSSLLALSLALPLGIANAAFLSEIAPPRLRAIGTFLIELLAAIPSVVYGFWGLYFLAPLVNAVFRSLHPELNTGGNGIVTASLILAMMILPYVVSISTSACRAVPRAQREAALALGATRWQMIRHVVLPYARPGIIASGFLALGRALGETMAVTMLIGNRAEISLSPFALGDTIASRIANQLNEADNPTFRAALAALGLVLLFVTGLVNILARWSLARLDRPRLTISPMRLPSSSNRRPADPQAAQRSNRRMTVLLALGFAVTIGPLFLILGDIAIRGSRAVGPTLFLERDYGPMLDGDPLARPSGLGHAMLGSAMIVGLASLMAVPWGIAAATCLAGAGTSRWAAVVRFVTELLGGVPSIVVGIFANAVLVAPRYAWLTGRSDAEPLGFSAWAGAFALACVMVPIVVRAAEEAMKQVPEEWRQGSHALGGGLYHTTWRIIYPAALPAMLSGCLLAMGRIAGETAPLLLTAGGSSYWPASPAEPTPFLPKSILSGAVSPFPDMQQLAWGGAFVLLAAIVVLNVVIRLITAAKTAR